MRGNDTQRKRSTDRMSGSKVVDLSGRLGFQQTSAVDPSAVDAGAAPTHACDVTVIEVAELWNHGSGQFVAGRVPPHDLQLSEWHRNRTSRRQHLTQLEPNSRSARERPRNRYGRNDYAAVGAEQQRGELSGWRMCRPKRGPVCHVERDD